MAAAAGVESVGAGRQSQFKATHRKAEEAARRRRALAAQQSEARAGRIADVRRIAMEALLGSEDANDLEEEVEVEEEDEAGEQDADMAQPEQGRVSGKKMRRLRRLHRTLFFARQFQMPDWLLEMPQDLSTQWLVQVRPEGDRCLLLSEGGRVQVRRKNGYVLEHYSDSRFPRGLTILDVVCIEPPEEPESSHSATAAVTPAAMDGTDHPTSLASAREASGTNPAQDAAMTAEEEAEEAMAAAFEASVAGAGEEAAPPATAGDDVDMAGGARGRGRGGGSRGRGGAGRGGRGYAAAAAAAAAAGGEGRGKGKGSGKGQNNHRRRPVGDRKFAVCDVLVWGDNDLAGADAECRMFWLESRFSEMPDRPSRRARPLQLVPAVVATPEALSQAYHLDPGYPKDSLLFLHREGHYHVSDPVTPLALNWRDSQVSRWVIDMPDKKAGVPQRQAVVLELRGGGRLRTAERAIIAQLSEQELQTLQKDDQGAAIKGGVLVRCEVDAVDLTARRVSIVQVNGFVPARTRVWADSWGRIVFQHLHRQRKTDTISFQAVMRAAIGNTVPSRSEVK